MRVRVEERWPSIWKLPGGDASVQPGPPTRGSPRSILDVGATERVWEKEAAKFFPGAKYRSLDIDRSRTTTTTTTRSRKSLGLVLYLDVLEHLTPAQGVAIMKQCVDTCEPGGPFKSASGPQWRC